MSGHLSLKWNNHTTAFLRSFCTIQIKERFCDATLVCQGKYFPVHRLVLSTCSEYFDELFEKIECQHPYIVFKEISAIEMELLLNYMYQGEINVVQEMLPSLIKAAETLQIKGLAVPDDDLLHDKQPQLSSSRKRSLDESSEPHDKRKRNSVSSNEDNQNNSQSNNQNRNESSDNGVEYIDVKDNIKEESVDLGESSGEERLMFPETVMSTLPDNFPDIDSNVSIKQETSHDDDNQSTPQYSYNHNEQASSWQNSSVDNCRDDSSSLDGGGVPGDMPISCVYNSSSEHEEIFGLPQIYQSSDDGTQSSKMFQCTLCPYRTPQQGCLNSHLHFTHGGDKPFPCLICPAKFISNRDLIVHSRVHTGEKPFQCTRCLLKFRIQQHLHRHLKKKKPCVYVNQTNA